MRFAHKFSLGEGTVLERCGLVEQNSEKHPWVCLFFIYFCKQKWSHISGRFMYMFAVNYADYIPRWCFAPLSSNSNKNTRVYMQMFNRGINTAKKITYNIDDGEKNQWFQWCSPHFATTYAREETAEWCLCLQFNNKCTIYKDFNIYRFKNANIVFGYWSMGCFNKKHETWTFKGDEID